MKRASWALSLSASALGAVLAAGCGSSSTTNEDVLGTTASPTGSPTAAPTGPAPTYKNYADFAKAQNEQTAKPAGKDASKGQAAGKDASKGQAAGKGQ